MILYHGSKGGIDGPIKCESRDRCDFGKGFYAGETEIQTQTLVCGSVRPVFYTLEYDDTKIKSDHILKLDPNELWLDFVMFNRGVYDSLRGTQFYQNLSNIGKNKDIIIGPIADDGFRAAMDDFMDGETTKEVLLHSLPNHNFGNQIVAVSDLGCKAFKIVKEREPSEMELRNLQEKKIEQLDQGLRVYRDTKRVYGNIGDRLPDIIEKEKAHGKTR